jgi:LPXTG-site transpeptidase (sortase) family protein
MRKGNERARELAAVFAAACLLLFVPPVPVVPHAPAAAGAPRLLRFSPAGGEGLGRDTAVVLSFDRPMDLESVARAARFEPPVSFAVSGESECIIVPDTLLRPGAAYVFRLQPGVAEDRAGRELGEEMEISFTTRSDGVTIEISAFSFAGEVMEGRDPQGVASVIGNGVGHYPGAGRPGRSNYVVMAHASGRVYFPFNRLFQLQTGDTIRLTYGGRDFLYGVRENRVVRDTEVWIVDPTAHPVVTAFVCCAEDGRPSPTFHPPFRYVVRASLAGAVPGFP